jgi:dicarboxylate transporter 10
MQNDQKLPVDQRRNYRHCFEAIARIYRTEGFTALYCGFYLAVARAALVSAGQLAFYDEFKVRLMRTAHFKDDTRTHFVASMGAGLIATFFTMPVDVLKTLLQNARPCEKTSLATTVRLLLQADKYGLLKGFWPRYIRLGPFTILAFIFYERLKLVYHEHF